MQCVLFSHSRIGFVNNPDAKHTINFKRPYVRCAYQCDMRNSEQALKREVRKHFQGCGREYYFIFVNIKIYFVLQGIITHIGYLNLIR